MTIVGARPQFIKAVLVSHAIAAGTNAQEIFVHTGQHYDDNMSKIFFDELAIPKIDHHLGINESSHAEQTGKMLISIEALIQQEKPDWMLIYGDTNSTLAGALAAAKLHIPVAHVEAGLRSYNRKMPEELNRLIADSLADILFTPTEQAVVNLKKEGFADHRIVPVGDIMYDAALFYAEKSADKSHILKTLHLQKKKYILSTIHRAENTDDPQKLANIFSALEKINNTLLPVVMPLHPRTRKALQQHHPQLLANTKIKLIDPVGFLDMIMLEKNAKLIVTDSGGIQKEAFFYQVPCVTLREETEWLETVTLGWNHLADPSNEPFIIEKITAAIDAQGEKNQYPYGQGNTAQLIVECLVSN